MTKSSPEFYDPILEHDSVKETGVEHGDLWLLDDSAVNLEVSGQRAGAGAYALVYPWDLWIVNQPCSDSRRQKHRPEGHLVRGPASDICRR